MESVYKVNWLDKINKTIAMITASPDYQRYIAQKRARLRNKQWAEGGVGRRHGKRSTNYVRDLHCIVCGDATTLRAFKRCSTCAKTYVVGLYRGGADIDAIAATYSVSQTTVIKYLRDGSRALKTTQAVKRETRQLVAA